MAYLSGSLDVCPNWNLRHLNERWDPKSQELIEPEIQGAWL